MLVKQFSRSLWVLLFCIAISGFAQEFRVETDICLPNQKEKDPAQTLTLFTPQAVYDFLLTEPVEVVMFDPQRGRFVMLDPSRRIKTTLTTAEVLDFTAKIQAQAATAESRDTFLFKPQFKTTFDESSGWLTLSSPSMTYRAKGVRPKEPAAVARYHEFCDWYARLNAMRPSTGSLPPFARLELDQALASRGLIPEEVERTITFGGGKGRSQQVYSKHLLNWQLSGTDRERIDQVGGQLTTFTQVDFQKFCEPPAPNTAATKPNGKR